MFYWFGLHSASPSECCCNFTTGRDMLRLNIYNQDFLGNELRTFALLLVVEISGPQKCKCEIALTQTQRVLQKPGFQQEDV